MRLLPFSSAALAMAIVACGGQPSSSPVATPAPRSSSTRITATAANGEELPVTYVERIAVPVRNLVDAVAQDSAWTRHVYFTVRRNDALRFDREAPESDSIGRAVAEKIASAAAHGAFTPLPLGWDDSLSFDLLVVHPPLGMPVPDTSGAYFEFQVTRRVGTVSYVAPAYPPSLQSGGVGGRVIVRYIVGTDGRAEPESFTVIASPHPDFTAAVRDAVLATRYTPAELNGRKVRQIVMQPFTFETR